MLSRFKGLAAFQDSEADSQQLVHRRHDSPSPLLLPLFRPPPQIPHHRIPAQGAGGRQAEARPHPGASHPRQPAVTPLTRLAGFRGRAAESRPVLGAGAPLHRRHLAERQGGPPSVPPLRGWRPATPPVAASGRIASVAGRQPPGPLQSPGSIARWRVPGCPIPAGGARERNGPLPSGCGPPAVSSRSGQSRRRPRALRLSCSPCGGGLGSGCRLSPRTAGREAGSRASTGPVLAAFARHPGKGGRPGRVDPGVADAGLGQGGNQRMDGKRRRVR